MLKLVLKMEYLRCYVLEWFLLVLLWIGLIQLKFVKHFYKNKNLMLLWQSSSRWLKCLTEV